ncbi:MAG: DUF1449 domain-containing protein [gamma proteobacterium symbiont of Taylorina sp.]|nr:DUF1449 domain-containing protein [gamma proteobacterium symbiont of Taylorina sp.]
MFAIFLSKSMDPFYQNISSFPTAVFTLILIVCLLYWLVAILGFVDIDFLDMDIGAHDHTDIDMQHDLTSVDVLAGLLLRFGLYGIPITIIISFIALFGWFFCYYIVHYLFGFIPDGLLHFLAGFPVLFIAFYIAILITAQLIKPLRPLFKKAEQETLKKILGQTVIVRTSRVDKEFGEAIFEDGGAGLVLKVRSSGDETFKKGDVIVLLEYIEENNTYRVISEQDFTGT